VPIRLTSILSATAFLFILAGPAAAQPPAQPATGGDEQTMLIAAGLTFMNVSESTGVGVGVNALFNALRATETGRFGIVGDFGINDFEGGTITTLMGGGRYTFNTDTRVLPFAQFLVGIVHCCDDTDFRPSLGGGVDIAWRPNLNVRGEISFILGDSDATRFLLGVSFPINK
jgi:hypothetical protein